MAITITGAASAPYSTSAGSDGTATYTLDTSGLPFGQYYVNVANTATGANSNNVFVVYPAEQTTTTTTPTETYTESTDTSTAPAQTTTP